MNFGRIAKLTFTSEGKPVEFTFDDSMDLKFDVAYSLNQIYGGATISVCGMTRDFVINHLKVFEMGMAFQRKEQLGVKLEVGYKSGMPLAKIYQGTIFGNTISQGPDYWLNMQCQGQGIECKVKSWGFQEPLLFETACTNICQEMLGLPCRIAVQDEELKALKIPQFSTGKDPWRQHITVTRQIEAWSKGKVVAFYEDRLGKDGTICVVETKHYSKSVGDLMKIITEQSQPKSFSCLGTEGKGVVYGIPKLFIPGIELDVQLDNSICRGTKFTVESNIIPVTGLEYYVMMYQHKGHLRGNEWTTHIRGQLTNIEAYKTF